MGGLVNKSNLYQRLKLNTYENDFDINVNLRCNNRLCRYKTYKGLDNKKYLVIANSGDYIYSTRLHLDWNYKDGRFFRYSGVEEPEYYDIFKIKISNISISWNNILYYYTNTYYETVLNVKSHINIDSIKYIRIHKDNSFIFLEENSKINKKHIRFLKNDSSNRIKLKGSIEKRLQYSNRIEDIINLCRNHYIDYHLKL